MIKVIVKIHTESGLVMASILESDSMFAILRIIEAHCREYKLQNVWKVEVTEYESYWKNTPMAELF